MQREPSDRRPRRLLVWSPLIVVGLVATLLVALTPPADSPPAAPPAEPTLLVGAAMFDNGDPAPLEEAAGRRMGVRRTFWDDTRLAESLAVAAEDVRLGRVPLLSYKVGDWTAAADGAMDQWAREAAEELSTLDGPVMVAVHHEPEGDGDITEWTRMQQRLAPFFDLPGVEYGVVLTGYHQFYGDPAYSLESLWPEGVPIGFLGLDVYQSYGAVDEETGAVNRRWTDLDTTYFSRAEEFAASRSLAWGLAETGLTDLAFAERPEARTWFEDTARALAGRGASFFAYFNTPQNSGRNTWPLQGAKRDAFVDLVGGPLARRTGSSPLTLP